MSLKRLVVFTALGLLALAANAAQVVVPAVGTGGGIGGSRWQSDVMVHNTAPREIAVGMTLHLGTQGSRPQTFLLKPRQTMPLRDIVKSVFGVDSGTGALVFAVAERDLKYLAVTSRTYNVKTSDGFVEYGQDIPAVPETAAATAGQIAVLVNPSTVDGTSRFNFGVYALQNTTVRWELLRADGTSAAVKEVTYGIGEHQQHNSGVTDPHFLNARPEAGDTLYARIITGRAIVYGSAINSTGDPTFVPASLNREDVRIELSVDLDEDDRPELFDEDGDGVLDAPLVVYTSLYPAYVRIHASSEFGDPVKLEVVRSEADAVFLDTKGTMRIGAAGDLKNKMGSIVIRATAEGTTELFTIPVRFR